MLVRRLMNFRLLSIKYSLVAGEYSKANKRAEKMFRRHGDDVNVIAILADSHHFLGQYRQARNLYARVLDQLENSTSLKEENKPFLRAYVSYRQIEIDFLSSGEIVGPDVSAIRGIAVGKGMWVLYRFDIDATELPRAHI